VPDCIVGNGQRFLLGNVRSSIVWKEQGMLFHFSFLGNEEGELVSDLLLCGKFYD
jgi:hypothetical protein